MLSAGASRRKETGSKSGLSTPRSARDSGSFMAQIYKRASLGPSTLIFMTDNTTPADGAHTTNGVPHGYSTITPFLTVTDAKAALDFYASVFDAKIITAMTNNEAVVHAEIQFDNGRLELGEASSDYNTVASEPESDTVAFSLALYCTNVDRVVELAIAHGATLREPVAYFASGDRYGSIRDPFGVRWTIMTRVEDLSDEESEQQVKEWMETLG